MTRLMKSAKKEAGCWEYTEEFDAEALLRPKQHPSERMAALPKPCFFHVISGICGTHIYIDKNRYRRDKLGRELYSYVLTEVGNLVMIL